ncbi:MAG TPA: PilX N-terminal domain-containing pilus assembly protein [Terriglobales bacterium]|nr:PilX N-terminal domain-containing pilus assembly protein [Terriglobales bacterium]
MGKSRHSSDGFTLIAALLLLVLLSGIAVGMMFLVTNEGHMSGNEQEDNLAYYGAQSGIEMLTANLAALYQTSLSPTDNQIQALAGVYPSSTMVGTMNYVQAITYPNGKDANGNPISNVSTVSSGANQGLYAQIIPMNLTVNATRPGGASVNINRTVEVALIPVFQFGVFCGYDCSYFPGPNFSFGGRVHTNGNLFLGDGNNLVFNDKIAAFNQIVMDQLENGHLTSQNYTGAVWISTAAGGCPLNTFPPAGSNCVVLPASAPAAPGDASWSGGFPGVAGKTNQNFPSISKTLKGYFVNSLTGATNMQLPFVQNSCTSNPPPCTDPIQIIRKPLPQEAPGSALSQSRLYNKAQIRILLADTEAGLRPDLLPNLPTDNQDVQFVPNGTWPVNTAFDPKGNAVGGNEYFAMAKKNTNNWTPPINPNSGAAGTQFNWATWPLLGEITNNPPNGGDGAWLRVEYLDNSNPGKWVGVTKEWLGYGFGRAYNTVPTAPAGGNAINPNAILILQQLINNSTAPPTSPTGAGSVNNWYPINLYDTREGEMRDNANGCAVNGIMNAVELDVGNLALWLAGKNAYGGGSGKLVNLSQQNGYVLYFSDRRGMLPDPNQGNLLYGESGLEDVINWSQPLTSTTVDGVLEATATQYYFYSPEDVDLNGKLDNWGGANIGNGFNVITNTAVPNPYKATACNTTGLANAVTGARHVLKLVDGSLGNVPVRWDNNQGGFTVASENPVYVQGDYNSSKADPAWASNNVNNTVAHSAAAIIADAVTLLSNQWTDVNSLNNPTTLANRQPNADAYYRMAVAGGKNIPFPIPTWGASQDFGTDGGMHNFLRYLENWGGGGASVWYSGSLVSMYYSEYNTGTFKCCTVVYGAPASRKYYFDTLFLNPANLPPGTPTFEDINNLAYRQSFTPQ